MNFPLSSVVLADPLTGVSIGVRRWYFVIFRQGALDRDGFLVVVGLAESAALLHDNAVCVLADRLTTLPVYGAGYVGGASPGAGADVSSYHVIEWGSRDPLVVTPEEYRPLLQYAILEALRACG